MSEVRTETCASEDEIQALRAEVERLATIVESLARQVRKLDSRTLGMVMIG